MYNHIISTNEMQLEGRFISALVLVFMVCWVQLAKAQVEVIIESEPRAVVVTAKEPTMTARYAVEELVKHVKLATNVTLDIVPESKIPMVVSLN